MIKNKNKLLLGVAALGLFQVGEAKAQALPSLSGEMVFELQNEYTSNSDDPAADGYNNMFWRSELAPTLQINENFYIDGVAVFENIQDRDPNDDNYFDNEGAFIEEIKLNYENGAFSAMAGKFNPTFGSAWDFGRGIWSEDFAEDYEITEKIGVGASYAFGGEAKGTHTLSGSTFFADTTFLSSSVITKRDKARLSDGGVSNTEDPSSFALSLGGADMPALPGVTYQLAYRNQAEGDADTGTSREKGFSATLGYVHQLREDVEVDALVEFVDIQNFETSANDNQYVTGSVVTSFADGWNVTAGYTARNIDGPTVDDNDHLFQLSGGYDFGQGTTAEIGWRNSEESGVDTDIIGGLVRHIVEF